MGATYIFSYESDSTSFEHESQSKELGSEMVKCRQCVRGEEEETSRVILLLLQA
jgi:hypothetical protein